MRDYAMASSNATTGVVCKRSIPAKMMIGLVAAVVLTACAGSVALAADGAKEEAAQNAVDQKLVADEGSSQIDGDVLEVSDFEVAEEAAENASLVQDVVEEAQSEQSAVLVEEVYEIAADQAADMSSGVDGAAELVAEYDAEEAYGAALLVPSEEAVVDAEADVDLAVEIRA